MVTGRKIGCGAARVRTPCWRHAAVGLPAADSRALPFSAAMSKCSQCFAAFGFFKKEVWMARRRRHAAHPAQDYCRRCNKFFCAGCAPRKADLGKGPVRVCEPCLRLIR